MVNVTLRVNILLLVGGLGSSEVDFVVSVECNCGSGGGAEDDDGVDAPGRSSRSIEVLW